jgi:hypothetical protein
MIRLSLGCTALAAALAWVLAPTAPAQDTKAAPKTDTKAEPAPKATFVTPQAAKINELILKGYESAGIKKPAARATDHEYLRRVFIDLIGRIATPEEVQDFERDRSPDKRVKLVRRLLHTDGYQPKNKAGQFFTRSYDVAGKKNAKKETVTFDYTQEYADHWANIWTVWLMTRTGHQDYRDEMHVWLEHHFLPKQNTSHKDLVTRLLTATGQVGGQTTAGRPVYKDAYAANFVVHHLGEAIRDTRARDGAFDAVPITSRVTRTFLGLQTQCTQCHDHPFNKEWVQTDFWGVNAFFRQTVRSATPSAAPIANNQKMVRGVSVTLTDDPDLNKEMLVYFERRDGRRLGSFPVMLKDYEQALNGEKSKKMLAGPTTGKTRRQQLAEWVVGHDNFAKAYVNRMWAHFFGRGLNKEPSADDFGSNNDVVHPELLAYLGEEFAKYGYQHKMLMEWVCTSDVYQLSHVAQKEYTDIKFDPFFARMPLKAMSPEVLFESLMTATKPDKRTPDQQAERKTQRDAWMRKLVRQFGDDEGNELNFNGTIVQALLMMNGNELNGEIGVGRSADKSNAVSEVVGRPGMTPKKIYDELFLMTLNRPPTAAEIAKLEDVRNGKATISVGAPPAPKKGKGPLPKGGGTQVVPGAAPSDVRFYQDVFWALLNTNEFMLNH